MSLEKPTYEQLEALATAQAAAISHMSEQVSLRDRLAMAALTGLLARGETITKLEPELAYAFADVALVARSRATDSQIAAALTDAAKERMGVK